MKPTPSYLLLLLAGLLLAGCAQVVKPTGGPRDIEPPKIVESTPQNYSPGFASDRIILKFDEFIQTKDLNKQMIISPPLKYKPVVKVKGKYLELEIKDTLKENTTYSINFGEGVVDLTEGNALDSNTFVFSTGDYVDSLSISGRVKKAIDLSPAEEVLVMLYPDLNDSVPCRELPYYFTKTKKDGSFTITNIGARDYQIFALEDKNANYLFDQPNEAIAFPDSFLTIPGSDSIELSLFEENSGKQYLKREKAEHFGWVQFVFNLPAKDPTVTPLNFSAKKPWFIEELSKGRDSLSLYLTDVEGLDTLKLAVADGAGFIDTVKIKLPKRGEKAKGKKTKKPVNLDLKSPVKGRKIDYFRPFVISSNHPLKRFDPSKVTFTEGEDTLVVKAGIEGEVQKRLKLEHKFAPEKDYKLYILPGAIEDIFGFANDTIALTFSTRSIEDYGQFKLKVNAPDRGHPYVIQMMLKDNIVREDKITSGTVLEYPNLIPASYKFKLIYDSNGNGKWDTGQYGSRLQPEKVIYYSGEVEIRANWDVEVDWEIP